MATYTFNLEIYSDNDANCKIKQYNREKNEDDDLERSRNRNVICDFMNSNIINTYDLKSIDNEKTLYDRLLGEKTSLEKQLSLASCMVPIQIKNAVCQAEKAADKITELGVRQRSQHHLLVDFISQTEPEMSKLQSLSDKLIDLGKYKIFFIHLLHIENLSSDIQTCVMTESLSSAVDTFQSMRDLYFDLQSSMSVSLLNFLSQTILFWYKILLDKVSSEFKESLVAVRWPIISGINKPLNSTTNVALLHQNLTESFKQLMQLQLPNDLVMNGLSPLADLGNIPGLTDAILPLELMLTPFCKRFKYHFYGNKLTNNIEKPEWYLAQVVAWIRDHTDFLDTQVQPIVDSLSITATDVKVEFIRGLVKLTIEKMVFDLPDLVKNEDAFAHLIDEVLLFDNDLRSNFAYPTFYPGCLHVLCLPDAFEMWKLIEKKFAVEKMENLLTSANAWVSQYRDVAGLDNLHVPHSADMFISLMQTISDRYGNVPDAQCRLELLDLQLELIDDFRIRLVQIMKTTLHDALSQCYTSILNAVYYIIQVLTEWNEQVFFIQLQYERLKLDQSCMTALESPQCSFGTDQSGGKISTPASDLTHHLSCTGYNNSPIKSFIIDTQEVQGAVFDDILNLLHRMKNDMLKTVVNTVFTDVKARSLPYRKDRWASLPLQRDINFTLSTSAYEMLLVLKDHLQIMESLLSPPIFVNFWQNLSENIDKFILNEVILCNKFSDGGGAQLQFDMTRNLFPLFAKFTPKPEAYFRSVFEACHLLTLNAGSALLLKEVLKNSIPTLDKHGYSDRNDACSALQDVSLFTLTKQDSETILNIRTSLCI